MRSAVAHQSLSSRGWTGTCVAALFFFSVPLASAEKPSPKLPHCIQIKPEARYILGYDHLVHITNQCETTAHCQVSTDVNPAPQAVTVAPRKTETVLTFRGSPARVFVPHVACTLEPRSG